MHAHCTSVWLNILWCGLWNFLVLQIPLPEYYSEPPHHESLSRQDARVEAVRRQANSSLRWFPFTVSITCETGKYGTGNLPYLIQLSSLGAHIASHCRWEHGFLLPSVRPAVLGKHSFEESTPAVSSCQMLASLVSCFPFWSSRRMREVWR